MKRPSLLISLIALIALIPGQVVAKSGISAETPRAVAQQGRLSINGCVVKPGDIELTATPMVITGIPRPPEDTNPPGGPKLEQLPPHRAKVRTTNSPNIFTFVFEGLKVTSLYTVDVRLPAGACPKTTWVGPSRGVFAPTESRALDLAGYALTTRIEVQSPGVGGQPEVYRASDFGTLEDDARRFRWVSDLPGITDFELQVAAERFTPDKETSPDSCGSPNKLLWRQALKGGVGTNLTPKLDFGSLLQNEGAVLDDDSGQPPGVQVGEVTPGSAPPSKRACHSMCA